MNKKIMFLMVLDVIGLILGVIIVSYGISIFGNNSILSLVDIVFGILVILAFYSALKYRKGELNENR